MNIIYYIFYHNNKKYTFYITSYVKMVNKYIKNLNAMYN